MLREHTDLAIGTANETAQCPTNDAHDDGAEERIPKPINVEARHEASRQPECQRVHDEDEEPQRDEDKWQTQEQKNRTDKCIDDPEEQRHANQGHPSIGMNAREFSCYGYGEGGDDPAQ